MPINGISLISGATGISVTGGTPVVFDDDGLEVKNGIHILDFNEPNALERRHATFKNKGYARQSDGTFSKGVRSFNFTSPFILASGDVSYQTFKAEMTIHPELLAADILQLRLMACQCIMDGELDDYFNAGSLK